MLMNSPNDVSSLERMIDAGTIDPREIVALIGKTEVIGASPGDFRG
jgi:cyanuric acid amidohydrolase